MRVYTTRINKNSFRMKNVLINEITNFQVHILYIITIKKLKNGLLKFPNCMNIVEFFIFCGFYINFIKLMLCYSNFICGILIFKCYVNSTFKSLIFFSNKYCKLLKDMILSESS